jgi:hypothetical protein
MKFSKMCDYANKPHFVCKTGRKNIRILEVGQPYEKSFVVPLKKISNRRPSDFIEDPEEETTEDSPELEEANEDLEFQPQ